MPPNRKTTMAAKRVSVMDSMTSEISAGSNVSNPGTRRAVYSEARKRYNDAEKGEGKQDRAKLAFQIVANVTADIHHEKSFVERLLQTHRESNPSMIPEEPCPNYHLDFEVHSESDDSSDEMDESAIKAAVEASRKSFQTMLDKCPHARRCALCADLQNFFGGPAGGLEDLKKKYSEFSDEWDNLGASMNKNAEVANQLLESLESQGWTSGRRISQARLSFSKRKKPVEDQAKMLDAADSADSNQPGYEGATPSQPVENSDALQESADRLPSSSSFAVPDSLQATGGSAGFPHDGSIPGSRGLDNAEGCASNLGTVGDAWIPPGTDPQDMLQRLSAIQADRDGKPVVGDDALSPAGAYPGFEAAKITNDGVFVDNSAACARLKPIQRADANPRVPHSHCNPNSLRENRLSLGTVEAVRAERRRLRRGLPSLARVDFRIPTPPCLEPGARTSRPFNGPTLMRTNSRSPRSFSAAMFRVEAESPRGATRRESRYAEVPCGQMVRAWKSRMATVT